MADPASTGSSSSLNRRDLFLGASSSSQRVGGVARDLFGGAPFLSLGDDAADRETELEGYDLNVAPAPLFDVGAAGFDAPPPVFDLAAYETTGYGAAEYGLAGYGSTTYGAAATSSAAAAVGGGRVAPAVLNTAPTGGRGKAVVGGRGKAAGGGRRAAAGGGRGGGATAEGGLGAAPGGGRGAVGFKAPRPSRSTASAVAAFDGAALRSMKARPRSTVPSQTSQ